jgi:hypothetical protein
VAEIDIILQINLLLTKPLVTSYFEDFRFGPSLLVLIALSACFDIMSGKANTAVKVWLVGLRSVQVSAAQAVE